MSGPTALTCAISIDFGQTTIKGGLVCQNGEVFGIEHCPTELGPQPDSVVSDFLHIIASLRNQAAHHNRQVIGIGLSSTVDVVAHKGCFRESNHADLKKWGNFPIADTLHQLSGLPVVVENDGIAAAWGEYRVGAGAGFRSLIHLMLGTGIGGGAILENNFLSDTLGSASNFGHMTIDFNGPLCPCGQQGCWELYVSGGALEKQARQYQHNELVHLYGDKSLTGREIIEAARNGDLFCRQLLEEQGRYLGIGLVSLANIFNPEVFIIGGGLANAGDLLLEPARQHLIQTRIPLRENIPVIDSKLGMTAGVVGAGLLVWERLGSGYEL